MFTLVELMTSVSFSPLGNISSKTHILTSSEFHIKKEKRKTLNSKWVFIKTHFWLLTKVEKAKEIKILYIKMSNSREAQVQLCQ